MDYARDLGQVDLWEESLKRSLERRGRPRRSSVELYRLRPERNLGTGEELERSASYSELRRRVARGTTMPRPGVAVSGISALTVLAGATLPSLLSGARAARKERIAYTADAHARAKTEAAVRGTYAAGSAKARTAQLDLTNEPSIIRTQVDRQLNTASASHRVASAREAVQTSAPATPAASQHAAASPAGTSHSAAASATIVHGTLLREATGTSGGVALRHASRTGGISAPHSLPPTVAAVRELQQRLHLDPVDGSFGPVTEQAVKAFQQAHGLDATGVVSASTWKALGVSPGVTLHPDAALLPAPVVTQPVTTTERAAAPGQAVHTTGGVATPTVATRTTTTTTTPTQTGPGTYVQTRLNDMVAAGNRIATRPYVYGGGHGSFTSYGYDCSGSVSYVLHAAGLLSAPEDSTELESYGAAGAGRYVTIYANSGHAWMTIQGRRFDTVALAETGSRWSRTMASTSGYVVRHPRGF